jgi:hypothetical protein
MLQPALSSAATGLAAVAPGAAALGLRHRLIEPLIAGPGGVTVGYELERRGGKRGRPRKRRDARRRGKVGRYLDRKRARAFGRTVRINLDDSMNHVQVIGPIAQGKTTMILTMAIQNLVDGLTVFTIELGGDFSQKLVPYAEALGRPVFVVDPSDLDSWKLNLLAGDPIRAAERAAESLEAVGASADEFFTAHGKEIIKALVLAAHAWGKKTGKPPTLETVQKLATSEDFRRFALDVREDEISKGDKKKRGGTFTVGSTLIGEQGREWWQDQYYGNMSEKEKNEFTRGMQNVVNALIWRPECRRILCPTGEPGEKELPLKHAIELGALIVIKLPAGTAGGGTGVDIGIWVMEYFMQVTRERERTECHPVIAYLDEMHMLLGSDGAAAAAKFKHWILVARHCNVGVVCSYQGFELIHRDLRPILMGNMRNKLIFGGAEPPDDELIQRILSDDAMEVASRSRSRSSDGDRREGEHVAREEVFRWSREEISTIPRGQCFASRTIKGQRQYPTLIQVKKPPTVEKMRRLAERRSERRSRNGKAD